MMISQSEKSQELLMYPQVQPRKPSIAMMKPALITTAPGKEDQESPLLQRFIRVTRLKNCELIAPQIRAHINASKSSSSRHISTSTVQRRPSWLNCCKEATTEEEKQEKAKYLGHEQ